RDGDQPEDRAGAWPQHPPTAPGGSQRGDRVRAAPPLRSRRRRRAPCRNPGSGHRSLPAARRCAPDPGGGGPRPCARTARAAGGSDPAGACFPWPSALPTPISGFALNRVYKAAEGKFPCLERAQRVFYEPVAALDGWPRSTTGNARGCLTVTTRCSAKATGARTGCGAATEGSGAAVVSSSAAIAGGSPPEVRPAAAARVAKQNAVTSHSTAGANRRDAGTNAPSTRPKPLFAANKPETSGE